MTPPGCRHVLPLLEVFTDGELSAERVLEVEQHLSECGRCRERVRFGNALKLSTRSAVLNAAQPSGALQARIAAAMAAERAREEACRVNQEDSYRGRWLSWNTIVPIAAAAALSVAWAKSQHDLLPDSRPASSPVELNASVSGSPMTGVDRLIEQFVNHHTSPTAPDVTEPAHISQLEFQVGVPVPRPSLDQYGARWEGGSLVAMPLHNQRAASLRYRVAGHRVTLYVYNADRFPLRATLEPRVVRDQPVFVGSRRGYTLAAIEQRGVGYALTTDLSDRESAELLASTVH